MRNIRVAVLVVSAATGAAAVAAARFRGGSFTSRVASLRSVTATAPSDHGPDRVPARARAAAAGRSPEPVTARLLTLPAAMTVPALLAAPDPHADGFSRGSMRDRARWADGDPRISSAPGHGTEAEVRL